MIVNCLNVRWDQTHFATYLQEKRQRCCTSYRGYKSCTNITTSGHTYKIHTICIVVMPVIGSWFIMTARYYQKGIRTYILHSLAFCIHKIFHICHGVRISTVCKNETQAYCTFRIQVFAHIEFTYNNRISLQLSWGPNVLWKYDIQPPRRPLFLRRW